MDESIDNLKASQVVFIENKNIILNQWIAYNVPRDILDRHEIDEEYFLQKYVSGVFDYFMGVISGEVEIGNCPVMQELLTYLKVREISADELFALCSHFRRSMVDFSYDEGLNSKELFDEISYIFDENFKGILKFYTDTIFQKLIDARQDAIKASQAKEYFLSNMSHEIRTPLNAILGFVNLLLDDDISKKHRNYLDIIHSSGENLLSIINDILDFSKLRSGEFTLEPKNFSIHEEISHTMELFVASANMKNITIVSFIDPGIPIELLGDALRIKQILSNFLSNAIKFTSVGGVIKVEALYKKKQLHLSVKDNGIGIYEDDIDKIFSAFAQVHSGGHVNEGGTGLGLSICYQLAQKMHGSVDVVSEVGMGSTFSLTIPLEALTEKKQEFDDIESFQKLKLALYSKNGKITYKDDSFLRYAKVFDMNIAVVDNFEESYDVALFVHDECSAEFIESLKHSDKKHIALMSGKYDYYDAYPNIAVLTFPLYCSKIYQVFNELINHPYAASFVRPKVEQYRGHILVAEDNDANQELIKIILQKYGLTFDIASNGLEALNLFKVKKYDLVLMDEQMPVMNGNEAVAKIIEYEQSKGISHTPISALTANVIKGAKERGLLSGFDAFLGKPIVLKELQRVFTTYLKAAGQERKNTSNIVEGKEDIVGLDSVKLMEELMLEYDELLMLLKLFIKKMIKVLPELYEAIEKKEYKKIELLAHSIKGSSGNFRVKILQESASEMESMAKDENSSYDYIKTFDILRSKIREIQIV